MTAQNKQIEQWLQENPGIKARYESAPEGARKMLELWAALDTEGKRKSAQLIQAATLQEGALSRELKKLSEESLNAQPED